MQQTFVCQLYIKHHARDRNAKPQGTESCSKAKHINRQASNPKVMASNVLVNINQLAQGMVVVGMGNVLFAEFANFYGVNTLCDHL